MLLGTASVRALLRRQFGLARPIAVRVLALDLLDQELFGLGVFHGARTLPQTHGADARS